MIACYKGEHSVRPGHVACCTVRAGATMVTRWRDVTCLPCLLASFRHVGSGMSVHIATGVLVEPYGQGLLATDPATGWRVAVLIEVGEFGFPQVGDAWTEVARRITAQFDI